MSAPNVSDGAVPEWAVKAAEEVLGYIHWEKLPKEIQADNAAIIARHCPVGCAANEVGTVVAAYKADMEKLEAEVAQEKGHHDFYQSKVLAYMGAEIEWQKLVADLRAQLAISGNEVIRLNGLLRVAHTERNDALRSTSAPAYNEEEVRMKIAGILLSTNIIKDTTDKILALFTPAPTAPVGDGALVRRQALLDAAQEVESHWNNAHGMVMQQAQAKRSGKILRDMADRALTVPTGSVKEGA